MNRIGLATALLLLASSAFAGAPLEDCARPLRVGFYPIPPLYYQRADDPTWRGLDKDIIDELARRTGCRFAASFDSRVRTWAAIRAGQLDLTVSGIASPERERFAYFIPYLQTRNLLVVRAGAPDAPETAEAALKSPQLTLAATRGYKYGPPFDAWIEVLTKTQRVSDSGDEEAALHLVTIGRVDAAIVREAAWDYYFTLGGAKGNGLRLLDVGAPFVPAGLALSKQQIGPKLAGRLAAEVSRMKHDGTLERLARKHMSAELAQRIVSY